MPGQGKARYRVWFSKTGQLRFISHHDLMRLLQRAVRRAGLPVSFSQGFNPRPKLSFPIPLAVYHEGLREPFEMTLEEELPPEEIKKALSPQLPDGLGLLDVESLPPGMKARVISLRYSIHFPRPLDARAKPVIDGVQVSRLRRDGRRETLSLSDFLEEFSLEEKTVRIRVRIKDGKTIRPEEVAVALGLEGSETAKQLRIVRDGVEIEDRSA